MLITPHAAAGAAIGTWNGNPLTIIPVAVASHFILDSVPHWQETLAPYTPNRNTYIRVPLDLALAIGLTIIAAHWQPHYVATIWLGAVFANLPDLDGIVVLIPKLKKGIVRKYWDWHCRIQHETGSLWGVLPQLAVLVLSLWLVQAR